MAEKIVKVSGKLLRTVEIDALQSNQHEFHGIEAFKRIFGKERFYGNASAFSISDKMEVQKSIIKFTWYDARESDPKRSEHRLYYTNDSISFDLKVDDLMFLGKSESGEYVILFVSQDNVLYEELLDKLERIPIGEHFALELDEDLNIISDLWNSCMNNNKLI